MFTLKCIICLSLSVATALVPVASISADTSTKTREQLFLDVFNRPALDVPVNSYVVLVVNDGSPHKVKATLPNGDSDMLLEAKPILTALSQQFLLPRTLQQLALKIDDHGWLSLTDLNEAGFSSTFNSSIFQLSVTTDPKMRSTQVRYLSQPSVDPFTVPSLRPADVSAFVNFDLKALVTEKKTATTIRHQTKVGVSANGAINVMGLVAEGSATAQTGTSNSVRRGDFRLIYDQPQRALRYTLGDLRYPVVGYQNNLNMAGFGISKDFSLQPHVRTYRSDHFEFYLERPAQVEVWVNESLVTTLELPAGTHDIRGFTPAVGQNDSRLIIEDDSGRKQTLNFSYIFSPALLSKGRAKFSYNLGVRRQVKGGVYHYDLNQPIVSASYLTGFTDRTTLGAYGQADSQLTLAGVKSIHAMAAGKVVLDIAASRSMDGKYGMGAKMAWSGTPNERYGLGIQSQLDLEYTSKHFGLRSTSSPPQRNVVNANASLGLSIGNGIYANIRGRYTPARTHGLADSHQLGLTLSRRFGKHISTSAVFRRRLSSQDQIQTEILFGINFNYSKGVHNFALTKEVESDTIAAKWHSRHPGSNSGPYGFASIRRGDGQLEHLGGAGYWGNQGLAEISHSRNKTATDTSTSSRNQTKLHLRTSLVMADSTVALARPVAQGFVIVKGKQGLANVPLTVNPDGRGGSQAQSTWVSPAVLTNIPNYRLQSVSVEPVNPPLGATPEKMTFPLLATYKSGFLLDLGQDRTLFAIGRLVDEQGSPLAHQPIEIRSIGNPDASPVIGVTSRNGRFQMPDIKPGQYEIRALSISQHGSVIVQIPNTEKSMYRLEDVVVLK